MFKLRHVILPGVLIAALMVSSSIAHAQASRTWVSGVGDDANPCSRTAPCKTFAGAISKTAANGQINVIDPGGFGGVTITKSITIDGGGMYSGVLVSGTNAIIVNAGANDVVTLRNLNIQGFKTGINGIRFLAGKALHVEKCQIFDFSNYGIDFEPTAGMTELHVADTIIRDNINSTATAGGGLFIKPGGTAFVTADLTNTLLKRNFQGLRAEDGVQVMAQDTTAANNITYGFIAASFNSTGVQINLENSAALFTRNAANNSGYGIYSVNNGVGANALITLSNTKIMGNYRGIRDVVNGSRVLSYSNNKIANNAPGGDGAPSGTIAPM